MTELDLTWGNAEFLYPFWKDKFQTKFESDYHMQYYRGNGFGELKKSILKLHSKIGNIGYRPHYRYQVVIGNGATQMLQAALYAIDAIKVHATAPYFMRFPVMSKLAGCEFTSSLTECDTVISTLPNNPDGKYLLPSSKRKVIYDMCYNWPQYVRDPNQLIQLQGAIQVYSLSKATGHAGLRFGWAVTDDRIYAEKMKEFIEYQTSGVSVESQVKATCVIDSEMIDSNGCMSIGKEIMETRWKIIESSSLGNVENKQGMFLWSSNKKFFEERSVLGISGEHFGAEDNYYRINIGCSEEKWKEFQRRCLS